MSFSFFASSPKKLCTGVPRDAITKTITRPLFILPCTFSTTTCTRTVSIYHLLDIYVTRNTFTVDNKNNNSSNNNDNNKNNDNNNNNNKRALFNTLLIICQ